MKKKINDIMLSLVVDYLLILILLITGLTSNAQEANSEETRRFQIGFVPPMGSNGLESGKFTNQISLNMLVGYAGGLDGVELAGFYNILNGDMQGVQVAGFGNTTLGTTKGVQLAGFLNTNLKSVDAVQIAGFANVLNDNVKGIQLSGFANIVNGDVEGIQLSGFSNIANGNLKGMQMSGFANISTKDVDGVQMSGFFNYAKILSGLQLGIINISDSVAEGLPLGLINIVKKNGYFAFELATSEILYGQLNYKMGLEKFYTIFKLGYSNQNESTIVSYGLGFGTILPLAEKHQMAFEISSQNLNEDKPWNDHFDLLSQFDISYQYKISNHLLLTAGPTLNLYSTNHKYNDQKGIIELPYSLYEYENSGYKHSSWIGFKAGLIYNI